MNTLAMNSAPRVGHDGKVWPETFDGMCWAEAFNARFPSVPVDDAIGWFANAIMRGWDEKTWRDAAALASPNSAQPPEPAAPAMPPCSPTLTQCPRCNNPNGPRLGPCDYGFPRTQDVVATASEAPTDEQIDEIFAAHWKAGEQCYDRRGIARAVLATTRPPLDLMGVDASRHETERSGKFPDAADGDRA